MINNLIIASVNPYTSGSADKNGKAPVILNVVAGTFPNRNVISGTIAENLNISVGKTYLFQVREVEADEYGRKFNYSVLKELEAMEIVKATKELGNAIMIEVGSAKEGNQAIANAKHEFDKVGK